MDWDSTLPEKTKQHIILIQKQMCDRDIRVDAGVICGSWSQKWRNRSEKWFRKFACEALCNFGMGKIVDTRCVSLWAPLLPFTKWIHHRQLFPTLLAMATSEIFNLRWFCGQILWWFSSHLITLMGVWWQHPLEIHNQVILCPNIMVSPPFFFKP